jgi:endonuclease/exonuclease/phosphatase family metal-dependent hydrolase
MGLKQTGHEDCGNKARRPDRGRDHFYSSGRGYDFGGLVRVAGDGGRWPHILVLGEGDRYELAGGEGMWEAAAAMRDAGGRPYVPLACELPAEGLYAPVIFTDPQAIVVRRFYYHRLPDHAPRYSNLLVATVAGRPWGEIFRVRTGHGALNGGDSRLADAMRLRRLADPSIPTLVAMDWNSVPSGPMWEDQGLNDPGLWGPQAPQWRRAHRVLWRHGPQQAGPYVPDTRALDYLIGWWDPERERRAGGIGFYDTAELAGDHTPTQVPVPQGWPHRAIDRVLVNEPWKDAIVPGSFQVHQPADPASPDSDHLRVSVAVDV